MALLSEVYCITDLNTCEAKEKFGPGERFFPAPMGPPPGPPPLPPGPPALAAPFRFLLCLDGRVDSAKTGQQH